MVVHVLVKKKKKKEFQILYLRDGKSKGNVLSDFHFALSGSMKSKSGSPSDVRTRSWASPEVRPTFGLEEERVRKSVGLSDCQSPRWSNRFSDVCLVGYVSCKHRLSRRSNPQNRWITGESTLSRACCSSPRFLGERRCHTVVYFAKKLSKMQFLKLLENLFIIIYFFVLWPQNEFLRPV